jgi:hypothetical protein
MTCLSTSMLKYGIHAPELCSSVLEDVGCAAGGLETGSDSVLGLASD